MRKVLLIMLSLLVVTASGIFADGQGEASSTGRPEVEITKAYYFGEPTDNSEFKEEWM